MDQHSDKSSKPPDAKGIWLERAKKIAEPRLSVTDHLIQYGAQLATVGVGVWGWIGSVPVVFWVPLVIFTFIGVAEVSSRWRRHGSDSPLSRASLPWGFTVLFFLLCVAMVANQFSLGDQQMDVKKLLATIAMVLLIAGGLISLAIYQFLRSQTVPEVATAMAWSEGDSAAIEAVEAASDPVPDPKVKELEAAIAAKNEEAADEKKRANNLQEQLDAANRSIGDVRSELEGELQASQAERDKAISEKERLQKQIDQRALDDKRHALSDIAAKAYSGLFKSHAGQPNDKAAYLAAIDLLEARANIKPGTPQEFSDWSMALDQELQYLDHALYVHSGKVVNPKEISTIEAQVSSLRAPKDFDRSNPERNAALNRIDAIVEGLRNKVSEAK